MRAVVALEQGALELNYLWLPTCIGMNSMLKAEMEKELAAKFTGRCLDDTTLDAAHDAVVEFIEKKFPDMQGFSRYIDAMKYLEFKR